MSAPEVKAARFFPYVLKTAFSKSAYSNVRFAAPHQPLYRLQPCSEFLWVPFIKGKGRREQRGLNLLNSPGDQHRIY